MAIRRKTTRVSRRLREQAEQILSREISFVYSRKFEKWTEEDVPLAPASVLYRSEGGRTAEIPDGDLLTAAGERILFRRLNFLRYAANRLRARPSSKAPKAKVVAEILRLLAAAEEARAMIAEANLRLVAKLARKLASETDYEDFRGEGNFILLYAIDKFDIDRGFRFSTYATHAVQRHMYRLLQRKARRKQKETAAPSTLLAETTAIGITLDEPAFDPKLLGEIGDLMDTTLEPREKQILRARFGIGGDRGMPLRAIATRMGLSKERVRQLQNRALAKLQELLQRRGVIQQPALG